MPKQWQIDQDQQQPGPEPADKASLKQYCQDLYLEYKDSEYRQKKLEERLESRKRYAGIRDPKTEPWEGCSNRSLMVDAVVIDNIEPRIVAQLFGDSDFVNVEPVGPEDVDRADAAKEFTTWALKSNMDIERQIRPAVHDLLLDGTAYLIPIWNEKTTMNYIRTVVKQFQSADGQTWELTDEQLQNPSIQQAIQMGLMRYVGISEKQEQRPSTSFKVSIEQVQLNDAFTPDTGEPWEDQPFLRLIYPTYQELIDLSEANGGPYKGIDETLIMDDARDGVETKDEVQEEHGIRHSRYTKEVQLLECYIFWDGEWWLETLAIDKAYREVRRQPVAQIYSHAHKPVTRIDIFRESNESMGTGLPQKIKHFSTGADALYNQMIDNGTIEIVPFWFFEDVIGWKSTNKKLRPGQGIAVPKGANIQFPRFGTDSTKFMVFIELLLQMQERLVSLMAYTQAGQVNRGSAGSETYAGMSLLVNESNIKHNYMGEGLRSSLGYLIRDILSLYGQYMPLDAKQRIFDESQNAYVFQPFDLQAIQGQYDITINVSNSSGNKMLSRQEKTELLNMFGQDPMINPIELRKDVLDSYDVKNKTEYINPDASSMVQAVIANPELPQVVQQYLQQKAEQQQQQELQSQAQANVQRQSIARDVEKQAPQFEQTKLFDQVEESAKRKLITPAIENMVGARAMGGM